MLTARRNVPQELQRVVADIYTDINYVLDRIKDIDIKEYVVKEDPTSSSPFSESDNAYPKRRIVNYQGTFYEFIKTSHGWKYHTLT